MNEPHKQNEKNYQLNSEIGWIWTWTKAISKRDHTIANKWTIFQSEGQVYKGASKKRNEL